MKSLFNSLLIITVMMLSTARAATPLKDPEPVPIPPGLSQEQVAESVKRGMARRYWRSQNEEPGKLLVVIHVRSHIVKVNIAWDENVVCISYHDSRNMGFKMSRPVSKVDDSDEYDYGSSPVEVEEEGALIPYIHGRYNSWTRNLANDIRNELDIKAWENSRG